MTLSLEQIDAAFDALSEDNQLRLIDHLACRTEYGNELGEGLEAAAIAFGRAHAGTDEMAGDRAEWLADDLLPIGKCSPAEWTAHVASRDKYLAYALTPKFYGKAA